LQLRLRRAELQEWQVAAARLGVGVSELVRRLVEGPGSAGAAALRRPRSWRGVFVEALRRSGSVAAACRAAGVSRTLVYRERRQSPSFASCWEHAVEDAEVRLLDLLWLRGMVGIPRVKRTVTRWADGSEVEVRTEWTDLSTRALIEWLRRSDLSTPALIELLRRSDPDELRQIVEASSAARLAGAGGEEGVDGVGGVVLQAGEDVGVGVEGDADAGVAESFGDDLGVHALHE
jgi:hypothetical protein